VGRNPSDRHMKDPLAILLGGKIADARKAQGLTQEALGERLGISAATVCYYEVGRSQLHMRQLFNLCLALGLDPADLISNVLQEGSHLLQTFDQRDRND
jgi:transcriptional regulator with XRE-family HTH domain